MFKTLIHTPICKCCLSNEIPRATVRYLMRVSLFARARAEMCGRLASAVQEPPLDLVEPSITHITVPQLANREAEDLGAIVAN